MKRILGLLSILAAAGLLLFTFGGYRLGLTVHTVSQRMPLYGGMEDMMLPERPSIGYLLPGERCVLVQQAAKAIPASRVRCGEREGWVTEIDAFDPPIAF